MLIISDACHTSEEIRISLDGELKNLT